MEGPKGYEFALLGPENTDSGMYGTVDGNRVLISFTAIAKSGFTDTVKWGTCFWVKLDSKHMDLMIINGTEEAVYLVEDVIIFDKKLLPLRKEFPLSG